MIDPTLKEEGPAINRRVLRQFAGVWLIAFAGLAIWNVVGVGRPRPAIAFAIVALVVGIPGLIRPMAIRTIFVVAMAATKPIGRVISVALLASLYYLLFVPIALLFRAMGRDALVRRRGRDRATYWVVREQTTDPRRYLHQA
jgi:hypothetical protein